MKSIVVYYSLEGNTKEAAEVIAASLGADLLEVEPMRSVNKSGAGKFIVGGAQATFGICPPLKPVTLELDLYDRIILGTPVWAGKCAPAINSLLKKYSINDKIEAVFTCSGGGDNEGCLTKLKKNLPNIKWTVALADRSNPISGENNVSIERFVEEIQSGK